MGNVRWLRTRLCPKRREITPDRTLYVKTEAGGRTTQTLEALKEKMAGSSQLGTCPAQIEGGVVRKGLVSLYAQHCNSITNNRQRTFVSVGELCIHCGYAKLKPDISSTTLPVIEIQAQES
jgi:hypothetical protein